MEDGRVSYTHVNRKRIDVKLVESSIIYIITYIVLVVKQRFDMNACFGSN